MYLGYRTVWPGSSCCARKWSPSALRGRAGCPVCHSVLPVLPTAAAILAGFATLARSPELRLGGRALDQESRAVHACGTRRPARRDRPRRTPPAFRRGRRHGRPQGPGRRRRRAYAVAVRRGDGAREATAAADYVYRQIESAVDGDWDLAGRLVVAYEPVWAIGAAEPAAAAYVSDVVQRLRGQLTTAGVPGAAGHLRRIGQAGTAANPRGGLGPVPGPVCARSREFRARAR